MEKVAQIKRYSFYKHIDYSISDMIDILGGPLMPTLNEVAALSETILTDPDLRDKETNGITIKGLFKSVDHSLRRMQYLLDMIILNIESICPALIPQIPDIKHLKIISNEEASTLVTWYQPNETEEMFLCDQIDFEFNEEDDVEYLTAKKSINISATTLSLVIYTKLLGEFKAELNKFIAEKGEKTRTLKKIIYIQSMIKNFDELIYYSTRTPDDIMFYFPLKCTKWDRLQDYYELIELATEKEVDESYANFAHMVICGNSAISKGAETSNKLLGFVKTSLYGGYYFLDKKSSMDQYNYFFANPKLEITMTLFNLLEKEFVTSMYNMNMPDMKVHKVIYVPKLENNFDKVLKADLNSPDEEDKNELEELPPQNTSYHMKDDIFDSDTHVKVRVLSNLQIPAFKETKVMGKFELSDIGPHTLYNSIFSKNNDSEHEAHEDEAILHVHGGGFISMSSKSHQIYSRILARDSKIPIFSVDYRLSPKNKYPDALEDCWNVYDWLVKYGKINLGKSCSKITLIGDSAGGNLVAALTNLIIKNRYPLPHKLILVYPALSLQRSVVLPSVYYSMTDPVLNSAFLKLCIKSYIDFDKHDPETDDLISPILAPNSVLEKYPPTRIMVGTKDPLRDLSYMLIEKLIKLNKNVKLAEFLYFPHGFLNYDVPVGGVKGAGKTIKKLVEWLKEEVDYEVEVHKRVISDDMEVDEVKSNGT